MEGTKQRRKPQSFQVRYKVLEDMNLLTPEQVELVDLALRRLEQGEETLWRSFYLPDLHYVFLESRASSSEPKGSSTDTAVTITLSVEVREGGFEVEVTDLVG